MGEFEKDAVLRLSGHLRPYQLPERTSDAWLWTDGTDTYFARDLEHLREMFEEHNGSTWEESDGGSDDMRDAWVREAIDDTKLKVWFDDPTDIARDAPKGCEVMGVGRMSTTGHPELTRWCAIATRREWFEVVGFGFFVSTEY